jgi:hypothetical protein
MSCQVELHDDETGFATSVGGFLEAVCDSRHYFFRPL